jgi:hypothetical protein
MTAVNISILSVPLYITHLLQLYHYTCIRLAVNSAKMKPIGNNIISTHVTSVNASTRRRVKNGSFTEFPGPVGWLNNLGWEDTFRQILDRCYHRAFPVSNKTLIQRFMDCIQFLECKYIKTISRRYGAYSNPDTSSWRENIIHYTCIRLAINSAKMKPIGNNIISTHVTLKTGYNPWQEDGWKTGHLPNSRDTSGDWKISGERTHFGKFSCFCRP